MALPGVLEPIGVIDGFDPSVASLGSTIAVARISPASARPGLTLARW